MKRRILNTIFARKLGLGKFTLSGLAFVLGLSLVLVALQGYIRIREFILPQRSSSNFIILNKEVAMAHTLLGGKAHFTDDEIAELKQQSFAAEVGTFQSNNFQVRAYVGGDLGFYTELFFESVPSTFIDNKPYNFKWEEQADFLPIIISQDFLNLYNFGYAVGRGTPQLSKSTIQLVPLKVEVTGPGGRRIYDAKVVGFSERIASVLVPEGFLTWANSNIGGSDSQAVSRAIVRLRNEQTQQLEEYLDENNLQIADDKLKFGKIVTSLNVVMSSLVAIGTAFIAFALVIVMMNFSLMVTQAREEVSLLLQLGYKGKDLVKHLSSYLFIFMAVVSAITVGAFLATTHFMSDFLVSNGMDISRAITPEAVVAAVTFVLIASFASYLSIHQLIRRQLR